MSLCIIVLQNMKIAVCKVLLTYCIASYGKEYRTKSIAEMSLDEGHQK